MVEGHENDVDEDTQGDEDFGEGVENNEREDLADSDPKAAAVPDAEHVASIGQFLLDHPFQLFIIILVIFFPTVQTSRDVRCCHAVNHFNQDSDVLETSVKIGVKTEQSP